jgi:uncharacterized lipoprotein NlpE involved in copper resistance
MAVLPNPASFRGRPFQIKGTFLSRPKGDIIIEAQQGYLSVVLHGNENVELVAMGDGLGGGEGKGDPEHRIRRLRTQMKLAVLGLVCVVCVAGQQ